jgi:hypothetical protein
VRAERAFVRRSERLLYAAIAGSGSQAVPLAAAVSGPMAQFETTDNSPAGPLST